MEIKVDDLAGAEIVKLLEFHLRSLAAISQPESMHALDLSGLRKPEITFWSIWSGPELIGCGALKELGPTHGELKSMRTAPGHLRKGAASRLVQHMIEEAKRRGYKRLSLETGSVAAFEPARQLYAKFGFLPCGPFANYREDPNSTYMTREV